jgi:putative membrane protein
MGYEEKHPIRGVLAGVLGGLAAAWVMNEFMAGPGKKLQEAVQTNDETQHADAKQAEATQDDSQPKEDATMKTADAIVEAVTGEHLTMEQKEKGGPIVHYAFGAIMGGIYGGLAEYSPAVRSGFGTTFGSALFTGADLLAVPALKLGGAPTDLSASALATPFAAHVVYGATTELVRRIVRAIL